MNISQIREIVRKELPAAMREDPEVREFVLQIASMHYSGKQETESRFDRVLNELRLDREEQRKKWDEQNKKWDEQNKKWDEQNKKWDEQNIKWEKNHEEIKSLISRIETGFGALGARWGIKTEESFRNALKGILEDTFGVEVLNVVEFDDTGTVFDAPDQVELDIIVKNGVLMICEIKSSMSRGDVAIFNRKINFYEKRHDRKADRKIIVSPMVDRYGRKAAEKLGIEFYTGSSDIEGL